jgi:hypothetical protein
VIGVGVAHDHPLLRIVAELKQFSTSGEERCRRRANEFAPTIHPSAETAAPYRCDDDGERLLGRLR